MEHRNRKSYFELTRQGKAKRLKRIYSKYMQDDQCNAAEDDEFVDPNKELNESPDTISLPCNINDCFPENCDSGIQGQSVFDEFCDDALCYSSDSDESSEGENPNRKFFEKENLVDDLKLQLTDWACKFQINHAALTALLLFLRTHSCFFGLPADSRTLLKTQRKVEVIEMDPGLYHHIGLKKSLQLVWKNVKELVNHIELVVGIDGLPLFKSASCEVWPILGSVSNIPSIKSLIFPIGIYAGKGKPKSCNFFLSEFVKEVVTYITEGVVINGKNLTLSVKGFICDTPAKAFILNTKGHTGYSSCTKCTQKGVWVQSRMTFPEINAPKRTHEAFLQQQDPRFHNNGITLLTQIPGIDFIKSFPIDYMHLVCLGVMRTLLFLWVNVQGTKLPHWIISSISDKLVALKDNIPIEFNRKPRSIDELKRWKATELRQFLFYTGPVVLKEVFKDVCYRHLYEHFLSLSVSVFILASPKLCSDANIDYARHLLEHFVETTKTIYGEQYITYNMHNLIHLPESIVDFGTIESSSAFSFENFLQVFKKYVRKGEKPLQQIIKRCSEVMNSSSWLLDNSASDTEYPNFKNNHLNGPILSTSDSAKQFSSLYYNTYELTTKKPNSCCILKSGEVVVIRNIVFSKQLREMTIICEKFLSTKNFYSQPLIESSALSVFVVNNLSPLMEVPINQINGKMVLLPFKDKFVALPLLHTT